MRYLLLFFAFAGLQIKAQLPSSLSFTMHIGGYTHSITCDHPFVPVILESDYTVSPVTYSWTNGTANYTGTLVNVTSPGIYSITAYANPTLSLVQILGVSVNTLAPTSTLNALSHSIICGGAGATVTAIASSTASTHYFMSPAGGSFVIQAPSASYIAGMPGTYTHVAVNNVNGCSVQKTFSVTAPSGFPSFSLTSPQNFSLGCNSKTVAAVSIIQAFTNPPNNPLSYTITASTAYTPGPATTYTFTNAPSIPITYTAVVKDDATQCESKVAVTILENTQPTLPFIYYSGGNIITCKKPGLLCKIIQFEPGNYSFAWCTPFSFTAPVVPNHPYDTITVFPDPVLSSPGFMSPWAIVTDNNSTCWNAISMGIDQDMMPPYVTMKRNYSSITCQHPNVVLTCTAMSSSQAWNPGAVVANLWEGPSPQATGTLSSGYIAYTAGIYTVHVVDLKSGCTNTDTMQIKDLRAYPQVTTPLQPYELCQSTATLQPVNSSTVPLSFTWTAAPGATVSNLISQQLIVNSAGIYSLLVTDPTNTCSVKLQFTVTICTGMEEFRNPARVSVYPNPAGDHIIIETNTRQNSVITDAMGRNIGELNIEAGRNRLDLSTYPPGIYFISVKKENELIKTVKVIKEN